MVNKKQPSKEELERRAKILAENKRLDAYEKEHKIVRLCMYEVVMYNGGYQTGKLMSIDQWLEYYHEVTNIPE